jgi:hypothetical protein
MSPSDRFSNVLLTLAWLLFVSHLMLTQPPAPAGRLPSADAAAPASPFFSDDSRPVGVPARVPASFPAGSPAALAPFSGRCFYWVPPPADGGDRKEKLEFCFFSHVRQLHMPAQLDPASLGVWGEWVRDGVMRYADGDVCAGFGARETEVVLKCDRGVQGNVYTRLGAGVDLVDFKEYDVCKYRLTLAMAAVCEGA